MKNYIFCSKTPYYLLIILTLGIINYLQAENPNTTGAKQFANEFFLTSTPQFIKGKVIKKAPLIQRYQSHADVKSPLFVFQQENNGFALVAQSNNTFQVVGYSNKGDFQADKIPPQLQELMSFYEDSLQFMNISAVPFRVGTPVVEPLLDKYNINLNQFGHSEVGGCPTGCVASAVTQIMLFHEANLGKPIKGYGSHCYTDDKYGQICADFENADYTSNNELLSFHVGNAMDMQYCGSPYGSAPRRGIPVIKESFHYYIGNASPEDYYIKNELDNERPVYTGLRGEPVGHAVVLDGYDDRGYFHVNFGWGGHANGYYLLNKSEFIGFSPFKFYTNINGPVVIYPTFIPTNKSDSLALVALHNSLGGTAATGWDLSEPVFSWPGVLTFNERVIYLTIDSPIPSPAAQSIPNEIGNLTALRKLFIGGCLNGNIPSTLANLTDLEEINIYNKAIYINPTLHKGNLKGQLPANIGNLTKLQWLSISNCFEGSIPSSLTNLTNLKLLRLYQDTTYFGKGGLTGNIPSDMGNLKKLQTLHISNQQLIGTLPATLSNLSDLRYLELPGNRLTGTIPIISSPYLSYIELNNNLLLGIAEGTWNCPELVSFSASNNLIKGNIPSGLCSLTNMGRLDLSNNQIETLPKEIGNLINLGTLNMSNNNLRVIPDGAIYLNKLTSFSASNNQIEYINKDFGQFPYLEQIDLSNNQLTFIPEELGNCPELYDIRFNSNKIVKIPDSFVNLRKYVDVYFQDNEMQGQIPEKLITFSNFDRYINLYNNRFIFSDIPKSDQLRVGVRDQKNVSLNKQIFNVQIGDTVVLDIRNLSRLSDPGNEYYWVKYPKHLTNMMYDERMDGIENNPIMTVVIDETTVNNQYYCKVFNPQSPTFVFDYNGSTVKSPCMYYLNTDTISFRLASDEKLISEKYDDNYVVSSENVPDKIVEDQLVTLVPPLKVRGTIQWQASADGKVWVDLSETMSQNDLKSNFVSEKQNELLLSPKTPAYYRCSVQDLNCEPLYSDTVKVNPFGRLLYDETINVSEESKTVSVDSIEVTLPAKLYDKDFRLTIVKLDRPPLMPDSVKPGSAYDVTVSFDAAFNIPLLIKLKNIIKSSINERDIDKFKAVYFDDKNHKWIPYEFSHISLKDSTLLFETNHLTKLSWWWDDEVLWGYTDVYQRNNIRVFYKETDVDSMRLKYGASQTPQSWHVTGIPLYVQDVTEYLHEVMTAFKGEGLPVPEHVFTVYVKKMKDNDGVVGLLGMLNHYLTINCDIKTPEKLRSLLAHEFMHYIQDKYIAAHPGNIFWMEAHAPLSDRLVWDENIISPCESEHYLLDGIMKTNSIFNFLHNSWDYWDSSILTQNGWGNLDYCYLAGTFMHYMRTYRSGSPKLNPATLLKETAWFGSWRSYLDSYIKTHLNSTIGDEYENYVKFLLEGSEKNFTLLDKEGSNPYSYLLSISRDKKFSEKIIYDFGKDDKDPKVDNLNFKIPYLASKVFILYNKSTDKNVVVRYKPQYEADENYKVYYGKYDILTKKMTYVDISDSTKYSLLLEARSEKSIKELTNTAFLLFVNKKNPGKTDFSTDFDASFELTAMPVLNIESIGMLQMYNGSNIQPYSFDDGTSAIVTIGNPPTQFLSMATGFAVSLSDFISTKILANDSTLKVNNQYSLIIDQGRVKGDLTMIDSTLYSQTIDYNFYTGDMNITEKEKKIYRLHPLIELPSENLIQAGYLQHTIEQIKTYWLKDIVSYMQPEAVRIGWESSYGNNIQLFETSNTTETKKAIEKIQTNYKRTDYNVKGEVTGVEQRNYQSTDYSSPNLIIRMIIHETPLE